MVRHFKKTVWIAALAMIFTAALEARDYYGAIAYSPSTRHYGYSYDYDYKWGAENSALNQCNRNDCQVVIWFRNACGALAIGPYGYGSGWGSTRYGAEQAALRSCRKYSNGCRIERWVCTTR